MPSELNFLLGSAIALFLLGITSMLVALRLQCSLRGTRSNIATAIALGARPASLSASLEEAIMAPVNGTVLFHEPSSTVLIPFLAQTENDFTDVHLIVCRRELSHLFPVVVHEGFGLQAVVALPRLLNKLRQSIAHHWTAPVVDEIMELLKNALPCSHNR